MIECWFYDDDKRRRLVVKGHAQNDGKEVNAVCAAVTALVACIASNVVFDESLGYIRSKNVAMVSGAADISVTPAVDAKTRVFTWFDAIVYGLFKLSEQYPQDISIVG